MTALHVAESAAVMGSTCALSQLLPLDLGGNGCRILREATPDRSCANYDVGH